MSTDKIARLRSLHERMRTLQKEIQQIQYDMWDLCKDMETEQMMGAIALTEEKYQEFCLKSGIITEELMTSLIGDMGEKAKHGEIAL